MQCLQTHCTQRNQGGTSPLTRQLQQEVRKKSVKTEAVVSGGESRTTFHLFCSLSSEPSESWTKVDSHCGKLTFILSPTLIFELLNFKMSWQCRSSREDWGDVDSRQCCDDTEPDWTENKWLETRRDERNPHQHSQTSLIRNGEDQTIPPRWAAVPDG